MRINVHTRHLVLTDSILEHAMRRFAHALDQHQRHVNRVDVRLQDVNGPRGGRDKECEVIVSLLPSGSVVLKELDEDVHAAVSQAADRTKIVVGRRLDRGRGRHH